MAVVKTAVGIDAQIFAEGEELAKALHISRSDLYTRALAHMVRQHRRRAIRDAINAFEATLTDEERAEERFITEGLQRASTEAIRRATERGEA